MATYLKPIVLEDVFNIINFQQIQNNTTSFLGYAQLTLSNTFKNINTFLSDVFVNGTLYVTNLNISHTFLGYNISMFNGLKAPIQAQFDSITTGGNVNIQSTVSVDETITVSNETPASVENIGTNINANLRFYIPEGAPAIQPEFSIGDVKTTASPSVTLTGTTIKPVLNFGLVTGNDGITPSFSIGTVTSQSTPSVSLTGTTANPVLNFGLQKGDTGAAGKDATQPSFSIGTVSSASTPSVSLGGTNPNYQLNFGLVPGLNGTNGTNGTTPTFKVGTVTDSSNASVSLGGTSPNYELNFGLVPGTTPTFKIGTVESVNNPYVNISYDSSINPVLNFGLKTGDTGGKGDPGPKGSPGKDADTTALGLAVTAAAGSAGIAGTAATTAVGAAGTATTSATAAGTAATAAEEALLQINTKLVYFTANTALHKEICSAILTVSNGVSDTVYLSPTDTSIFGNDVLFDEHIISKGSITNYQHHDALTNTNDNYPLNIASASHLNLSCGGGDYRIYINGGGIIMNTDVLQNEIKPINATDSLTISHANVIIPGINSITAPLTTVPPTETSLTLSHDNVIVSNKLKVNEMISNATATPENPYSELLISHDNVVVSEMLNTNYIHSINSTDTIQMQGKIINITAPLKTNILDADSQVNITADKTSIRGKKIYIGNFDGTSEIYIIGNVHYHNTEREAAFMNEFDGLIQQNRI